MNKGGITPIDIITVYCAYNKSTDNVADEYSQFSEIRSKISSLKGDPQIANLNLDGRSFTQLVLKNKKDLSQVFGLDRVVAQKLYEIGTDLLGKERKNSFFGTLIDRISHFIKGQGFRTEGEWTVSVAQQIQKKWEDQCVHDSKQLGKKLGSIKDPKLVINTLNEPDFTKFVKEKVMSMELLEVLKLIRILDDRHKEPLINAFLEHKNGIPMLNLLYKTAVTRDPENNPFINDPLIERIMVEKFHEDFFGDFQKYELFQHYVKNPENNLI